ncbi:MAG: glucose-1-phosphate adenylyltransferase, partial [Bifidobacteriaceae bacterium]|jgi:glucose-1-phosphate adenylyltransferase|nr:glucose-1-phosphate adenylyltransferase [Bifidobacteriaceae bacterium]
VVLHDAQIGRHAHVNRAIIDKSVTVAEGATVGIDHELDRARGYAVTAGGITVVPKGATVEA